jgi:hypothetical protein
VQDDQHDPRHNERDQQSRVESREQVAEPEPVAGFRGVVGDALAGRGWRAGHGWLLALGRGRALGRSARCPVYDGHLEIEMRSGLRSPADALDYKRVMIFKFR